MKDIKRKALKIFLGAEVTFIGLYYLVSSSGLHALRSADIHNSQLLEEVKLLETEVTALELDLEERKDNPFYKETIARKELQMAYENELIYLIDKKDIHV